MCTLSFWDLSREGTSERHIEGDKLRSFRPKAFPRTLVVHPMTYNTLHMVTILLRDVILVNLGFHMCSQCLSMLIPFSHTTNTHRVNLLRLGELPSGESTRYQGDTTWGFIDQLCVLSQLASLASHNRGLVHRLQPLQKS